MPFDAKQVRLIVKNPVSFKLGHFMFIDLSYKIISGVLPSAN